MNTAHTAVQQAEGAEAELSTELPEPLAAPALHNTSHSQAVEEPQHPCCPKAHLEAQQELQLASGRDAGGHLSAERPGW